MHKRFSTICRWCRWGNTLPDDSSGKAETWCASDMFKLRSGENNWPIVKSCKDFEQSDSWPYIDVIVNYALYQEFRCKVEKDRRIEGAELSM